MARLLQFLWSLTHPIRAWGPRCAAHPPWRLADAQPCCVYRGHPDDWHADGNGYIWNAERWQWMGPEVDLSDDLGPADLSPNPWAEFMEPPGGRL